MLEVLANWRDTPYHTYLQAQGTGENHHQPMMVEIVATNLLARTANIVNTFLAGNTSQLVVSESKF